MSAPDERAGEELAALAADVAGEHAALDNLVADLDEGEWRRATPSPGWTVADQIAHLTYFDQRAVMALTAPDEFRADVEVLMRHLDEGLDAYTLAELRRLTPSELLAAWREARSSLARALVRVNDDARIPWYGPAMSARSFASARLMETWAHGTDVADALGRTLPATARLRHVARLGYLTRRWSYLVRQQEPPAGVVRVELRSPDDDAWSWGPADADDTVEGPAEEFCLVVTQRRHVADTTLRAGRLGQHWLARAQAFAGAPSEGPRPRRNP